METTEAEEHINQISPLSEDIQGNNLMHKEEKVNKLVNQCFD